MAITLDGTNGITTPTYGGADTSEYVVPVTAFKNRIINGAMTIDQRNAGASVTNVNGDVWTVDRWDAWGTAASKYTIQQNAGSVTPPVGFTKYLGVTSSSAYSVASGDYFVLQYPIEGNNIADLDWGTANAKTVTLSFWVRSSLTGTFGIIVQNGGGSRSYGLTYTISSANTWEYKTLTLAGDTTGTWSTDNSRGIGIRFGLGVGSSNNISAGSWQAANPWGVTGATSVVGTNGATFYLTGVQLEIGSTATSFDYRPYGTELNLCYRYFSRQTFYGSGVWGGSGGSVPVPSIPFIVPMRAAPTVAWVSGGIAGNGNNDYPITALNFQGSASTNGTVFGYTVTGSTGSNTQGCIIVGPVMTFSAEL